jgi:hypothetical protein
MAGSRLTMNVVDGGDVTIDELTNCLNIVAEWENVRSRRACG